MANYVIGDIHGQYEQLRTLVNKMNITDEDELFIIGDIVDKGEGAIDALKYLMSLPNCTCVAGNHELMMLGNMKFLMAEVNEDSLDNLTVESMGMLQEWMLNGAQYTLDGLSKLSIEERKDIIDFMQDFEVYVELEINGQQFLLVHAGLDNFSKDKLLEEYTVDELVWTRPDYGQAYYDDIIVVTGHTPTQMIAVNPKPGYIFKGNNHIAIDCGACNKNGRLAGICLDTGEEFYSRD